MTVGGNESKMDIGEIVLHAFELGVTVYVGNAETARGVNRANCREFGANGGAVTVRNWGDGAELNIARDSVKKTNLLYEEEVDAYGDALVGIEETVWKCTGVERRDMRSGRQWCE